MLTCDPDGPLMIQIVKLYPTPDANEFRAFGRVLSGTARKGDKVNVLGEGYSPEDEEDMVVQTIEAVYISESRSVVSVPPRSRTGLTRYVSTGTTSKSTECQQEISSPSQASTIPLRKRRRSPRPKRSTLSTSSLRSSISLNLYSKSLSNR